MNLGGNEAVDISKAHTHQWYGIYNMIPHVLKKTGERYSLVEFVAVWYLGMIQFAKRDTFFSTGPILSN